MAPHCDVNVCLAASIYFVLSETKAAATDRGKMSDSTTLNQNFEDVGKLRGAPLGCGRRARQFCPNCVTDGCCQNFETQ